MFKKAAMIFSFFILLSLTACQSGPPPKEAILGKWKAEKVKIPMIYEFKSDGILTTTIKDRMLTYRWELVEGNPCSLKVFRSDNTLDKTLTVKFSGNNKMEWSSDKFFGEQKSFVMIKVEN